MAIEIDRRAGDSAGKEGRCTIVRSLAVLTANNGRADGIGVNDIGGSAHHFRYGRIPGFFVSDFLGGNHGDR
ncbi:hypothetical protein FQZ97_1028370 [compost metagenome]